VLLQRATPKRGKLEEARRRAVSPGDVAHLMRETSLTEQSVVRRLVGRQRRIAWSGVRVRRWLDGLMNAAINRNGLVDLYQALISSKIRAC
jgi:hypothetical protein